MVDFMQWIEINVGIYTRQSRNIEDWDMEGLEVFLEKLFGMKKGSLDSADKGNLTKEALVELILEKAEDIYKSKEADFGQEKFREVERVII